MWCKSIIVVLVFAEIARSSSLTWDEFKVKYQKQYRSNEEEAHRQQIFLENVKHMKEYQQAHPDATFSMGINGLMDRRVEELITGSRSYLNIHSSASEIPLQTKADVPDTLDWREKNAVTEVRNQGMAVKDASIAAVEVIESYQAIQSKKLERGSVDQVAACCANSVDIFDCILKKLGGGICRQTDFNKSTATCDRTSCQPFAQFNQINKLPSGDENTMLTWIQDSTLFVGLYVDTNFLLYPGGIFSDSTCSQTEIDHVMQIVGYGTEGGQPYWLCKNSWGTTWGEQGYIRVARGKNTCAIATTVLQISYKASSGARSFDPTCLYLAISYFILRLFLNHC